MRGAFLRVLSKWWHVPVLFATSVLTGCATFGLVPQADAYLARTYGYTLTNVGWAGVAGFYASAFLQACAKLVRSLFPSKSGAVDVLVGDW